MAAATPTAGGPRPLPVDEVHAQAIVERHEPIGANPAKEGERLVIAADEHVLPVVHAFAGRGIGKCGGTAPKPRPCLTKGHPRASVSEGHGGAEPGKSAANDDDVRACAPSPASERSQIVAAMTARLGRGTRMIVLKTSYRARSTRVRISR